MPTSAGTAPDMSLTATTAGPGEAIRPCPAGTRRVRRNTRTGKKLLNAAIASGIGAALGGGIGRGRGALIGAGAGAGGYLTYRYVRDRRGRCVRRIVR
jgi:uncharacterized protein YcfJ